MTDILSPSCRSNARQHELSVVGAAMAAPASPNRVSMTSLNASSSPKAPSHRTKWLYSQNSPHRNKHGQSLAINDTSISAFSRGDGSLEVGRESRPHRQRSIFQPINHGPNHGLQYPTMSIVDIGVFTGNSPLGAWQGFKPPLPAYSITGSVTPQPSLMVSHFDYLSVTKTQEPNPNQLLESKSLRDLPYRIANENITGSRRPEKKRGSLSHDLAIPIPLRDLLFRSRYPPIMTPSRGACGKADGRVLEGLIGVDDKNIKILRSWDDANPQLATDVDDKGLSGDFKTLSTNVQDLDSNILESVPEYLHRITTDIKSAITTADGQVAQLSEEGSRQSNPATPRNNADYEGHEKMSDDDTEVFGGDKDGGDNDTSAYSLEEGSPLKCNGYKHRGSSTTTTQPPSDTPESGTSQDTGSGRFTTSNNGGTTPFEGLTPSPSRGKNSQEQDENVLAVDSNKDSPTKSFLPLPLICWFAANGLPCSNGKGHGSPEFRRLWSDHVCSKDSPNSHLLYEECQRCGRQFEDECSWKMHEKQLQSDSPCIRRPNDLQVQNDEPNRKGITEARAQKVTEAINQYMNDGTLPSGRQHGKWVDDNYERYIGQSSTTEVVARVELGKWLVAWYTIFPSVTIPSNPFTINITHQELLGLIRNELIKQSSMNRLPRLSDEHCSIIAEICQEYIGKWLLQKLEAAQSPKVKRQPAKRPTAKRQTAKRQTTKRQTAKRQKVGAPGSTQLQPEPTMGSTAQPPPLVGFRQAPGICLTASSTYTPNPCDGFSVVDCTSTVPTSFNDNASLCNDNDTFFNAPKAVENEGQSNQEGPGTSKLDLSSMGAQHDGQISVQDDLLDTSPQDDQVDISPPSNLMDRYFAENGGLELFGVWDQNNLNYGGY